METKTKYTKGDRVQVVNSKKYSGVGTVTRQHPKNVEVRLDSGQLVRFDPYFLLPEDADPSVVAAVTEVPTYVPPPMPGTVVKVKDEVVARQPKLKGLWIVGGTHGDKSRLFRLNNTDGQYWRVPNGQLEKVEATLTEV